MSGLALGAVWQAVQDRPPLVHCITNPVTANDCANLILAAGGSPVMADNPREAAQITARSQCLVLNLGTLQDTAFQAMLAAGQEANRQGIPVVLDPVGISASDFRFSCAQRLLREVSFSVIRGNSSEICSLAGQRSGAPGVDASLHDIHNGRLLSLAQTLSGRTGAAVAVSGPVDILAAQGQSCLVSNGVPEMARITGSGCMLTALMGACCGGRPQEPFCAAAAALCAMGYAGELARDKMLREQAGLSSFRTWLIDFISTMTPEALERGARYELS